MNYELRPLHGGTTAGADYQQPSQDRLDRSRLLLEINNAVVSLLDLESLLKVIFDRVRQVFQQTTTATLSVYDPDTNQLRVHMLHSPEPELFREGMPVELDGTPSGLAFTSGQAVLIHRVRVEDFPAPLVKRAYADGVRSGCSVPLISRGRAVGTITVGAASECAYSEADAELLAEVAQQIAMPVENALNFQRAERERERSRLLLEINNAVVTHLDLKELVKRVSASLRDIMPHDAAGIALYEPEHKHLREYTNVNYGELDAFHEGDVIPLEGTPAGEVFVTGRPMLIRRPNPAKYTADRYSRSPTEGSPKSACLALLASHGRNLGIAGVSSTREDWFTERDLELFSQIASQLALAVENALQYGEIESLKNKLVSEKLYLEEEIKTEYNFAEIVGRSDALKKVLRQVETVAPTDSCVLLCGETGTGKELIARAIHSLSARRERTLVKLNCAAIPTGLLESELFGHEKGAFTGAIAQRIGRFELAHKGTLLLDEVGEIPLELQPKLLRVLQEHEFERLGSSRTIKTDVRLVAATNCDLPRMVAEKKFRSDLFYRLNVFPIIIPPLRERADDIPLLTGYFTQKHSLRMNKRIETISKETVDALARYPWPGNVRELENFIERAVILTNGPELQVPLAELSAPADFAPAAAASSATPLKLLSLEDVERAHIEEVLRETRGAIAGRGGAAEILGLPASTLRSRMKKLGLK